MNDEVTGSLAETPHTISGHKLGPLGAEPEFSEEARMVQESVHRYAVQVMRPIGIKLDRMTPEEVIAANSPYWEARSKFLELGFGVEALLSLEPAERAKTMCILFEELGRRQSGGANAGGTDGLAASDLCIEDHHRQRTRGRYPRDRWRVRND